MEEDGGVKAAPVTRLRRRLSVELSDDTKSPSAPSTPTKKRGGRLAAKPQLELIDEDTTESSAKKSTRKSLAQDISEAGEKPVTPARHSTRIKSNTSLVSESEDKVLTPARRSTRIKSNTSVILETTQSVVDSPRAKRAAARRNSQVGSDTEVSLTPARTRRTRKGSTSSIDVEGTPSVSETVATPGRTRRARKVSTSSVDAPVETSQVEKPASLITEVISEEPENKLGKSTSNSEQDNDGSRDDSPSVRKSPRLKAKKDRNSKGRKSEPQEDMEQLKEANDITAADEHKQPSDSIAKDMNHSITNTVEKDLSVHSANLIDNLEPAPKKKNKKNKSYSDIESVELNNKRHRTKSWTTLCATPTHEDNFYSDNEITKRKLKKHGKIFNDKRLSEAGSGDGPEEIVVQQKGIKMDAFNTSKKSKSKQDYVVAENKSSSNSEKDVSITDSPKEVDTSNESNKENLLGVAPTHTEVSTIELITKKSPTAKIMSSVFMEDSDSNTEIKEKQANQNSDVVDGEDQCVPVVLHPTENQVTTGQSIFAVNAVDQVTSNTSCEPMDIDETIPENISITDGKDSEQCSVSNSEDLESSNNLNKSKKSQNISEENTDTKKYFLQEENPPKSKRKSSHSISEILINRSTSSRKSSLSLLDEKDSSQESPNLSKRKSSFTHDLEKSGNENKSTLVLSQIKDVSAAENSLTKPPQINNELSKSMNTEGKDGLVNKNLDIKYSTSTPVQQKNVEKLGMQMNTSIITPNNNSKVEIEQVRNKSNQDLSLQSKSSSKSSSTEEETEESESENEEATSKERINSFIEEAEDAGNDYESGDSQDEDERQFAEENEIVERGETLTSEEEFSDDSDYEKDSFLVSSDEEDKDLLSGSGDDLDMSDNELTMTAKSKKKFNERKEKERKEASKAMFAARHKLIDSEKNEKSESKPNKKNNRLRLDSTLLESGDDNKVPPKKNKRMRLESTLDSSSNKSYTEDKITDKNTSKISEAEEFVHKKKKTMRLSESMCNESPLNEKEITINTDNVEEDNPLFIKVKPEPKTPQKDLEISTVHFTDREDIQIVEVDENMSMVKSNETLDPLQATVVQDTNESDSDGSISENEEITNNYDSMLRDLNKNTMKIKTHDTSLNLDKKTKTTKPVILDQLNLTQINTKKKQNNNLELNEKSVKRMFKKLADTDDNSSEAIDLKLIFSDDSSDGYKNEHNFEKNKQTPERFIPLKRTEGKTDIPGSTDATTDHVDGTLDTSSKKKKKRKSSANAETDETANSGAELPFFFDTKGDLSDSDRTVHKSVNTSNKKKDRNNSVRIEPENDVDPIDNADSSEEPLEVSYVSDKNKKASKIVPDKLIEDNKGTSRQNIPGSEKKKNKNKNKIPPSHETEIEEPATVEITLTRNKKNKSLEPRENFDVEQAEVSVNKTPNSNKKKIKHLSESQSTTVNEVEAPTLELNTSRTPAKEKKQSKVKEVTCEVLKQVKSQLVPVEEPVIDKKRKRTSKDKSYEETNVENSSVSEKLNESVGNKKKKLKSSDSVENSVEKGLVREDVTINAITKKSKKAKHIETDEQEPPANRSKKRKEREDDESSKKSKILKENSFDEIHVPRLPPNIINQLEDQPNKHVLEKKKAKVTSTTDFIVENTITKRSKPSNFLEETICLNDDDNALVVKKKTNVRKPKVLPFLPTVSISDSGFTTNFQVNVITQKMEFVAQKNEVPHFKNDYLQEKRIKKLRTYDLYKKHRSVKLSKF